MDIFLWLNFVPKLNFRLCLCLVCTYNPTFVFICWLIGRVENGLEGTSFNPRERESDKRGRVEMVGLLVFDSILVFFDTFYFTHKVIIVFYCMEQKQFCFHFT